MRQCRLAPGLEKQIGKLEITQPPEGVHFAVGTDPRYRNEPDRVLDIKQLTAAKGSAEFADLELKNGESVRVIFNFDGG